MTLERKITLIATGYAMVLWVTNWRFETTYDRDVGLQFSSLDLRGLSATIGFVIALVCLRRLWLLVRELLARGVAIPTDAPVFGGTKLLLLLLPLALGFDHNNSEVLDDGTLAKTTFTYGGDLAGYTILFSACAIVLFRAVVRLEAVAYRTTPPTE
jgi:hypothetical protein